MIAGPREIGEIKLNRAVLQIPRLQTGCISVTLQIQRKPHFKGNTLRNFLTATIGLSALTLTACNAAPKGPDLGQVLDRTVYALEYVSQQKPDATEADITDTDIKSLESIMGQIMNATPAFYDKALGVTLLEDATFSGFTDANGNNVKDGSDKQIFTVEIDSENSRLIATDTISGQSTFARSAGTGFIAGALMGRLLGRQRSAGVKPGAFNSRKTSSRADYSKTRPAAKSRSRSGSSRGGK